MRQNSKNEKLASKSKKTNRKEAELPSEEISYNLVNVFEELIGLKEDIDSGYEELYQKFLSYKEDYEQLIRRPDQNATLTHSPFKDDNKANNFEKLAQKLKTPLTTTKQKSIFSLKPKILAIEPYQNASEAPSSEQKKVKNKKRNAKAAEISVILSETDNDIINDSVAQLKIQNEHEQQSTKIKKKLFKSKKSSKKKIRKNQKNQSTDANEENINNIVENEEKELDKQPIESQPRKSNPSKKPKLESNEGIESKTKTNSSNSTASNSNEAVPSTSASAVEDQNLAKPEKVSKKKNKKLTKTSEIKATPETRNETIKNEKPSGGQVEPNKLYPKTPVTNRLSRLIHLTSTIKKTSKVPLTRRAAALIAAAKKTTEEATKKHATPSNGNRNFSYIKNSISKLKSIHSTIDKRKKSISKLKSAEKRKSEKKVKMFYDNMVKGQTQENNEEVRTSNDNAQPKTSSASHKSSVNSNTTPSQTQSMEENERKETQAKISQNEKTPREELDSTKIRISDIISANAVTPHDKEIINKIIKMSPPKCLIPRLPNNLINANGSVLKANEVEKRLSSKIAVSTTNLAKFTPAKPITFQSLTNLNSAHKTQRKSFIKFLERNTPSKLTRTEMEEKRKLELMSKEAKEKERLLELEKQRKEKQDDMKKKREEKLKKIQELKEKARIENEQKAKELEMKQQKLPIVKPVTSSTANPIFSNTNNLLASAQKKATTLNLISKPAIRTSTATHESSVLKPISTNTNQLNKPANSVIDHEFLSSFKKSFIFQQQYQQESELQAQAIAKLQKPINLIRDNENVENMEKTYILNSPERQKNSQNFESYDPTPLQPPRLKNIDNYDVSDLKTDDDTDDDEEPSKPIPQWAREPYLSEKSQTQCTMMVNFTKLFKSSCNNEIVLENIFRVKRKKFNERSSSANWTTPPVWKSDGISGEESFMQFRKNF